MGFNRSQVKVFCPPVPVARVPVNRDSDSWRTLVSIVAPSKGTQLKKPEVFAGEKTKFKVWFRKITIYIGDCAELKIYEQKINVLFSYIEGIDIDGWVENYYDQYYDKDKIEKSKSPWSIHYTRVHNDLKERFTDANLVHQAQIKIELLY